MAWITLTAADLLGKFAGAEDDAARTAALAVGQADPVPGIIEQVVREVRGYVAGCAQNNVGPEGTIPDELKGAALNRIRFECSTRIPGGALMDEDRRASNRDALALLRDVAACRLAITQPETVSPEIIAGPGFQVASNNRRKARRDQTAGL